MRAVLTALVMVLPVIMPVSNANTEQLQTMSNMRLAGVPQPDIPKAIKGESCIAPTDFMRRNHMELLKHDRMDAVHFGNRKIRASLKQCIGCHAVKDAAGEPMTAKDPKHFCRSCHDYVAVKIDCFECHASRPDQSLKSRLDLHAPEAEALAAYVKGAGQ